MYQVLTRFVGAEYTLLQSRLFSRHYVIREGASQGLTSVVSARSAFVNVVTSKGSTMRHLHPRYNDPTSNRPDRLRQVYPITTGEVCKHFPHELRLSLGIETFCFMRHALFCIFSRCETALSSPRPEKLISATGCRSRVRFIIV